MTSPKTNPPKRWKLAILVWLVIYPTLLLLNYVLMPLMTNFALPLKALVMSLILVPFMVFVALPQLQRIFFKWLSK
jgi:antibiotic biosynthesis monooxygenase (ABM) superfamily enzyme